MYAHVKVACGMDPGGNVMRKVSLRSFLRGTLFATVVGLVGLGALQCFASGSNFAPVQKRIRHVFIITLENKSYDDSFGSSTQDPYLVNTLRPMGALLTHYYATGHVSLDNYIAMISGQSSSKQTEADCISYDDFRMTGIAPDGQAVGDGCVYPPRIKTLPDQLKRAGLTWRGYMEDMGNDPARESSVCGHPALNTKDPTQLPEAPSSSVPTGDQYAGRHNPFIYFHSIIDSADCSASVVNLSKLDADLVALTSTPNFVFITPNLCNDGHDGDGTGAQGKGCVTGQPGGLASSDLLLRTWVPKILASAAYQSDGLLIITFDESNFATLSKNVDASTGHTTVTATYSGEACCNQQIGPNVVRPATAIFPVNVNLTYRLVLTGVGGDRIGAVLISPFIRPGTVSNVPYNHYSMLKSLEDIFGLRPLGYAAQPALASFGPDVYTSP